jgi:hypothetical protein
VYGPTVFEEDAGLIVLLLLNQSRQCGYLVPDTNRENNIEPMKVLSLEKEFIERPSNNE